MQSPARVKYHHRRDRVRREHGEAMDIGDVCEGKEAEMPHRQDRTKPAIVQRNMPFVATDWEIFWQ